MKILVTGCNGQLGSEIRILSENQKHFTWIFTDQNELDLLDSNLYKNISKISPNFIINCAAYTDVDKAESEHDIASLLNYKAVDIISKWSNINQCKLLHISTDYVFDGNSNVPLKEDASTKSPINIYGNTKLKGEKACLKNDPKSIIIRTSWVYSSFGKNFVKTMSSLMSQRNSLNIVNDQIGSPTYAKDLAEVLVMILNHKDWCPGLYHYSNEGEVSWYDFAKSIKKYFGYSTIINGVFTEGYPTPAKRPRYSLLDKSKIKRTFNITIPKYEQSLEKCIKILKNEK